ncbi:MAG TPA: hypothetical protein VMZ28_19405 [Kofleriaceae bacterium]|nr:hypothetical protein [Kofleriaceae bacterium]
MGWARRLCARDICVSIAIGAVGASGCSSIGGGGDDDPSCAHPPCGAPGADGGGGGGGDGGGGGGDGDGGVDLGNFSEPMVIPALSSTMTGEGDPSLTEDGLELYFSSDRAGGGGGGQDIWVSRRESVGDDWGDPDPVPALNSADAEFDPEVSTDGLTLWMNSTRADAAAKGGFDLFVSTRETREDDWGGPTIVPVLNSVDSDMGAVMDASKTVLVFHRVTGGGVYGLYQSIRDDEDSAWGDPAPLTSVNSDPVADAYLSPDGLTVYFNSTRDGGDGSWDIWRATRQSPASLFTLPENVGELNTESHEANVALSNGMHYLVMTSARSGDHEIYQASR